MKILYSLFLCLIISMRVFAQKNETLSSKDKKIAEYFEKSYKKKSYKKFKGKITVNPNFVAFDDKNITFNTKEKLILAILKNGLIYPQMISEYQAEKYQEETIDHTQKRFMKLQKDWKTAFNITRLAMSNLRELKFAENGIKSKRFWVKTKADNFPGTIGYIFELTNNKATSGTSLEQFISDSRITFFEQEQYE